MQNLPDIGNPHHAHKLLRTFRYRLAIHHRNHHRGRLRCDSRDLHMSPTHNPLIHRSHSAHDLNISFCIQDELRTMQSVSGTATPFFRPTTLTVWSMSRIK